MNPIVSMLVRWYIFLFMLAAFASITIPFTEILPGLILSWIALIFFFIGAHLKPSKVINYGKPKIVNVPMYAVAATSVFCSLFATKFYTGQQVTSVIQGLASGASLYNDYQKYFADADISQFTFSKLPAIFSIYLLKLCVIYGFIRVTILESKLRPFHILCLIIIVISQMFFSIARGTSFEVFELILLVWFCLTLREILVNKKTSFLSAYKFITIICAIGALSLYSYNISARYSFGDIAPCATVELCLDQSALLYKISPGLAQLSYKLSGYFTFGIFYTSHVIKFFWLDSIDSFIVGLSPLISYFESSSQPGFMCDITLDCGAAWSPDLVSYFINYGIFVTLFIITLIGFLSTYLVRRISAHKSPIEIGALFYIFLSMVSLPVGNFITSSSSNILVITTIIIVLCSRPLLNLFRIIIK